MREIRPEAPEERKAKASKKEPYRTSENQIRLPDFPSRHTRLREEEDWQPIRYECSEESETKPRKEERQRVPARRTKREPIRRAGTEQARENKRAPERSAGAEPVNAKRQAAGKRKGTKKKKIVFRLFMVLLFAVAVISGAYAGKIGFLLDDTLGHLDRSMGVDLSSVEVSKQMEQQDEIINILLVGSDKRRGWDETGRSDSAMIATLDTRNNQLKLTSLMRDMYLPIPGHGENRFNASYSFGGVELLYQTVAENFEVAVDGYAVVDFYAFRKVIQELGGVKIKLTDAEYQYLVSAYPQKAWSRRLKPGNNHMSGAMALAYCRIRQDTQGDFGRTQRQRNVLNAILKKAKRLSLSELLALAEKIVPEISTDLTNEEIISYMKTILFMGETKIHQFRLPVDGSYTPQIIYGMDVLVTDVQQNKEALKQFIEQKADGGQ